jgi:hypothetical protein
MQKQTFTPARKENKNFVRLTPTSAFGISLLRHVRPTTELQNRSSRLVAGGFFRSMSNPDHPRRLERRWAPRYSFRTDLEIEWGSALIRGSTRDISSNGMFIESVDPLWVGAGFTARIGLEKPVKVDCFVKRVEPGRGMGVAVTVSEDQQQRYRELLSSLSTNLS